MRRIYLITIFITLLSVGFTINPSEIKQPDSPYFYGESEKEELFEAKDIALSELSKNISVMVSSSFENYAKDQDGDFTESCESIINTYSTITLRNIKPYQKPTSQGWYVLYYIHRDSLNIIYNERVKLIGDMYSQACKMEKSANLSGALQQYYYSLILMDSVPFSTIKYYDKNLRTEIPTAIKRILNNVKFVYEGDKREQTDQRFVNFGIYYNDLPVSKLDFSYIVKDDLYKTVAKDGRAICQLTGASVNYDDLDIRIQYSFGSERSQYTVVDQLWKAVKRKRFPENQRTIEMKKASPRKVASNNRAQIKKRTFNFLVENPDNCPIQDQILQATSILLDRISAGNFNNLTVDESSKEKLSALFQYNNPKILDENYPVSINKTYEGWEVRRIPFYCSYPSLNKQTTEYAILDFDNEGNLLDINFSVFDELYKKYVSENSDKKERNQKQIIIKFIEKYRTAFLNRDIETIETIFADEAVIIVGKIKKAEFQPKDYQYKKLSKTQPDIDYFKMTKEQYVSRQKRIFDKQQDIHLGFNTFKLLRKSKNSNVYGVSMRQQYKSTGYADEGHLFLLIDFNEAEPMIYVRSWQPQEWSEDQIVQLGNFNILGN